MSDLESAALALADPAYRILQFPYNKVQQTFAGILDQAAARASLGIPENFTLGAVIALGYQGGPGAFLVLVALVVLASVRVWLELLNGRRAADLHEEPYVPEPDCSRPRLP